MYYLRTTWTTPSLALICLALSMQPTLAQVNEFLEPSSSLTLTIDGQKLHVQPGEIVDVTINGKKAKVSVSLEDVKELRLEHLSFNYPSYFKYEAHFKRDTKIPVRWDLEGQDADVTVFRASSSALQLQGEQGALDAWMMELAGDNLVAENCTQLEVGKAKLQGTRYRLPVQMGTIRDELFFDAFEVPGDFGDVRYFLLLSGWDGENPKEEMLVRKLLRTSFKLSKAPAEVKQR